MQTDRKPSVIALSDQDRDHSFVPTKVGAGIARSDSQEPALGQRSEGQLSGRRDRATPMIAASTMTRSRSFGTTVWIVAILALSVLSGGAAHAERALSAMHRAGGLSIGSFAAFVTEASKRFGVPEHWIRAVMHVESGGKLRARSQKGAIGLMQIMPATWAELRARHGLGADPFDARDNIMAGSAYLRQLHDRFGAPGFLAAYNAGPRRYEHHLATGRPLPDETQAYVATLAPMIGIQQVSDKSFAVVDSSKLASAPLFVVRETSNTSGNVSSAHVPSSRPRCVQTPVDLSALVPQSGNLFVRRAGEVRSQ